jgi:hypothetical protein
MKNVTLTSALIYTGGSVAAAALFVLGTLPGNYTMVERFGGAFWVFLLCMIILMPIVIPAVRRRIR